MQKINSVTAQASSEVLPAPCTQARSLTEEELDQTSGGAANLVTGAIGAGVGGVVGGLGYAGSTIGQGNFSWSTFGGTVARTAVTGFLVGTGTSLVAASVTGAARGAHVLGTSMIGAAGAIETASSVKSENAGSDR